MLARRLLPLLDLTLLDDAAGDAELDALCARAANPYAAPAALCVWPRHVGPARARLSQMAGSLAGLPIATVANFPGGAADPARIDEDIGEALAAGADEIDLVLPYQALKAGRLATCESLLALARARCGPDIVLKIILETGELGTPELIVRASRMAIDAGADFIKTSTGRALVNATPEAAAIMLQAIRNGGGRCGFKAAGGIRTLEQANVYLHLAERHLDVDWVTPQHVRIGASALMDALLAQLATASGAGARTGGGGR